VDTTKLDPSRLIDLRTAAGRQSHLGPKPPAPNLRRGRGTQHDAVVRAAHEVAESNPIVLHRGAVPGHACEAVPAPGATAEQRAAAMACARQRAAGGQQQGGARGRARTAVAGVTAMLRLRGNGGQGSGGGPAPKRTYAAVAAAGHAAAPASGLKPALKKTNTGGAAATGSRKQGRKKLTKKGVTFLE
ncbi:hypothetical protein HK405_012107, partial [Cladochytrium tenue]